MNNPISPLFQEYYDRSMAHVDPIPGEYQQAAIGAKFDVDFTAFETMMRVPLVQKYSWSIPNQKALDTIASMHTHLLDPLAGTGYWASLLEKEGMDVLCGDICLDETNTYHPHQETYTEIEEVDALDLINRSGHNRMLLLSWPPYDEELGARIVSTFMSVSMHPIAYIGEGEGGCCGTDEMFDLLRDNYTLVEDIALPQWFGMHDYLSIYTR